jgi:SHS2 domain-containing protein
MDDAGYELFDHTADLGLRVTAPDLPALFAQAAAGLTAMLVDLPANVQPRHERRFEVAGDDREYLLFDWLKALLLAFETDRFVACACDVVVTAAGLEAAARGEPFDPSRHGLGREVKAVTYHGLSVTETAGGWQAEVIVDI